MFIKVASDHTITRLRVVDVRFPTSDELDGSDAMHVDPDYSAAYVILETDNGPEGHGLTFTIGRGTEIVCAACESLEMGNLEPSIKEAKFPLHDEL